MSFRLSGTTRNRQTAQAQNDEFEGLWLNPGITITNEDGSEEFVRFPRGVALSDLANFKVYASSDPEWAAKAQKANQVMDAIREKAKTLDEGEGIPVNLTIYLYRRQEAVEQASTTMDNKELAERLFG